MLHTRRAWSTRLTLYHRQEEKRQLGNDSSADLTRFILGCNPDPSRTLHDTIVLVVRMHDAQCVNQRDKVGRVGISSQAQQLICTVRERNILLQAITCHSVKTDPLAVPPVNSCERWVNELEILRVECDDVIGLKRSSRMVR